MKHMTHKQLKSTLKNWVGTERICITTRTSGRWSFCSTRWGDKKQETSMANVLGYSPEDIVKISTSDYILTDKPLKDWFNDDNKSEVINALETIGLTSKDVIKFIDTFDKLEQNREAGKRKNGETINGALALSCKDNHPMINLYGIADKGYKSENIYMVNGDNIDVELLSDYRNKKGARNKFKKDHGIGIVSPVNVINYRFENIISIFLDGRSYKVISK